jgi:hypothetical protein
MPRVPQRNKTRAQPLLATGKVEKITALPQVALQAENFVFSEKTLATYLVFNVNIPTWADNGILWLAPSTFVMYSNGDWVLSATKYYNGRIIFGARPFSIRWWFNAQYKNAQKSVIYANRYLADEEGYQAGTSNVVKTGNDAGFVHWLDQLAWITYWQSYEAFY